MMIDALYNYRQGDIHSAEFSDEFNKLCIPFEESLTEAQLTTFHKLLDCVSDTAAAEMRAAYKVGVQGQRGFDEGTSGLIIIKCKTKEICHP